MSLTNWLKADGLSLLRQRFETEQNTIELTFNDPNNGNATEEVKIAVDQRETIGALKKRIGMHTHIQTPKISQLHRTISEREIRKTGSVVGLATHEFRLRRKLLKKEFKDESQTLQQCYLFDGSALLVEKVRGSALTHRAHGLLTFASVYAGAVTQNG